MAGLEEHVEDPYFVGVKDKACVAQQGGVPGKGCRIAGHIDDALHGAFGDRAK